MRSFSCSSTSPPRRDPTDYKSLGRSLSADSDVTVPVLERLASTQIEQFPVLLIGGRSVESKCVPFQTHSAVKEDDSRSCCLFRDWLEETLKPKVVEAGAMFAKPKKYVQLSLGAVRKELTHYCFSTNLLRGKKA